VTYLIRVIRGGRLLGIRSGAGGPSSPGVESYMDTEGSKKGRHYALGTLVSASARAGPLSNVRTRRHEKMSRGGLWLRYLARFNRAARLLRQKGRGIERGFLCEQRARGEEGDFVVERMVNSAFWSDHCERGRQGRSVGRKKKKKEKKKKGFSTDQSELWREESQGGERFADLGRKGTRFFSNPLNDGRA